MKNALPLSAVVAFSLSALALSALVLSALVLSAPALAAHAMQPRRPPVFGDTPVHSLQRTAQWTDTGNAFVAFSHIHMVNIHDGWATTTLKIYRTGSGGMAWAPVKIPAGRLVTSDFLNAADADIVIENPVNHRFQLWVTTNGGQTWTSPNDLPGNPAAFNQLCFINRTDGWIADISQENMNGELLQIFRTINGGATWSRVWSERSDGYMNGMTFRTESTGWLTGAFSSPGRLYFLATLTGGSSWRAVQVPLPKSATNPFYPGVPQFFGHQGIWTLNLNNRLYVYQTKTGGRSWTLRGQLSTPSDVSAFVNRNDGWLWGDHRLLATQNGGQTWRTLFRADAGGQIHQVDFITPRIGWMILRNYSRNGLYKTMDGGMTWSHIGHLASPPFFRGQGKPGGGPG